MAWYYRSSSIVYRRRTAITVEPGAAGDVTVTIPATWDAFWSTIDTAGSGGKNIRVTLPDGVTLASYQLSGFSATSRTGDIQIDSPGTTSTTKATTLWLYWDPDVDDTDGSTSFTYSAAASGRITLAYPSGCSEYALTRDAPGSTEPQLQLHKTSTETLLVWLDCTACLDEGEFSQWSKRRDELTSVDVDVTTGGADQSAMYDVAKSSIVYDLQGRTWVRVFVTGGSDGTDYTVIITLEIDTAEDNGSGESILRTVEQRFLLRVNDPDDA